MGGPFSSQSADLHCVWGAYRHRSIFRELGQLIICESGYPYWVGEWTIALCPFRDNILIATNASKKDWGRVVELVRGVAQRAWGLPVACPRITAETPQSQGACYGQICKVLGVVFIKNEQGNGMAFVEPFALTDQWTLCLAEPLLTPACAYPGYLGAIFTGVLKNGLPFKNGWGGQILSATTWL